MADGVRIRIVGDDSDFVRTLEGLERRARLALQGASGGVMSGIQALAAGLGDSLDVAGGIQAQQGAAVAAASQLSNAAVGALRNDAAARAAGMQMAASFQSGLNSRRAAVTSAASAIARAAASAMQGNGAGGSVSSGVQAAVRSVSSGIGAVNSVQKAAAPAVARAPQPVDIAPQAVYLNVDGKTLAQVLTNDMRASISQRAKSIDMGVGRMG